MNPLLIAGIVAGVAAVLIARRGSAAMGSIRKDDPPPFPVVAKLFAAIVGQESRNKVDAINPHSGALGLGQVMPANVGPWSKEALGRTITRDEFLASRELQTRIIMFKLAQYLDQGMKATGKEDLAVRYAAAKWYSGRGEKYTDEKPQQTKGHSYPSIAQYAREVLERYKKVQA